MSRFVTVRTQHSGPSLLLYDLSSSLLNRQRQNELLKPDSRLKLKNRVPAAFLLRVSSR